MNESMLKSFLQILAGIAAQSPNPLLLARKHVEHYLEINFGKKIVQEKLSDFDHFFSQSKQWNGKLPFLESVCLDVNNEFSLKDKFLLLINIFNYYSLAEPFGKGHVSRSTDSLENLADWLKINITDFTNLRYFTLDQVHNIPEKKFLLFASGANPNFSNIKFYDCNNLKGHILFLYLHSANILLFRYNGGDYLELNSKTIFSQHTYLFPSGFHISSKENLTIFYGNIIKSILQNNKQSEVELTADEVTYNYRGSDKGVKSVTITGKSGEIIGIMGGSGVGKSTLLKIISGNLKPQKGSLLINGHDINSCFKDIKDIIGILHQEECLVEELTVYENLYFSTKLVLGELADHEIRRVVENKLDEFNLVDCKYNRVGTRGNRQLSGGQRKRLAIAMEIVREPKILLVDEPTSGLSSSDSESVMNILKNIALSGKLVVVNIHQPSSEIFKLFDSLILLDRGGIPVFWGNPTEAVLHFKKLSNKVDQDQSACISCGNIKPEQIFEIVEECKVDEFGQKTSTRKTSPHEWNSYYNSKVKELVLNFEKKNIPVPEHSLPNVLSQFKTFLVRNTLAKLRNTEFIFLSLALPPVLAVIISLFLKYSIPLEDAESGYSLYLNPNLAPFFLMCILASLFFGLIHSCNDIHKDRQLIVREQYIGLSVKSFYNSKIGFLILLSAYQTLTFSVLGSLIIELKGMVFHLWIMLFSASILGNLMGLIISTALKSIIAIYILVPFLLIPQILFSGLVVRFDNLNPKLTSENIVPIAGELMASRWASEAVIVHYYTKNFYNKQFFDIDFKESNIKYKLVNLLPDIQYSINISNNDSITAETKSRIINGLTLVNNNKSLVLPEVAALSDNDFKQEISLILAPLKKNISTTYRNLLLERDKKIESLYPNTIDGRKKMQNDRSKYHNKTIDELVRNQFYPKPFLVVDCKYIQKIDPIYQVSSSYIGRSHFFAPYKRIGNYLFETYWFNFLALWIMIFGLYFILILDIIPYIFIKFFNKYSLSNFLLTLLKTKKL